ncbi:hypothetical protein [Acetobacter sp. DmW_136]|nr:hypothetical protein [Acetobacter sp. DmW_136]
MTTSAYTSGQIATGGVSDFQEILSSGAKGEYQTITSTGEKYSYIAARF